MNDGLKKYRSILIEGLQKAEESLSRQTGPSLRWNFVLYSCCIICSYKKKGGLPHVHSLHKFHLWPALSN